MFGITIAKQTGNQPFLQTITFNLSQKGSYMHNSLTPPDEQSQHLASLIEQDITRSHQTGQPISRDAARRIAAAIHQGIDSQLERFAGTGMIQHHQLLRLELHYAAAQEPQITPWAEALRQFITFDEQQSDQLKGGQS